MAEYSRFVAEIVNRHTIRRSTIKVWSDSSHTGIAEGELFFEGSLRLRLREELDFEAQLITSYGYEVYRGPERLFWYDDFPHPDDPALTPTHPHHKHIQPDIKHHRVAAAEMSFTRPNLPVLLREIRTLLQAR